MLRLIAALVLLAATSTISAPAEAHGGGLDRHGCHNDRRNGGYHCHRGSTGGGSGGSSAPSSRQGLLTAPTVSTDRDVIRSAQVLLNHLGCDAGTVDGRAGAQTREAAARFDLATRGSASGSLIDSALVYRLTEAVASGQRC